MLLSLDNLLKKDKKYLLNLCERKNFIKKANSLAESLNSIKIFTDLFINYRNNTKYKPSNYFMFIKYFLVEIKQIFFGRPKPTNYKRWKISDRKLLQIFKIT